MKIQTVLGKEPGHLIPMDLLKLIVATKPTVFGFAVQDKDKDGNPELSITREETDLKTLLGDLEEFQSNAKDNRVLLCFGGPDKFNNDDILPLILNDGDDKPFMALGLEGDFPKFSEPSSGRTDEFHLADKIIIPSLLDICETAEGDLEKIIERLGRPLLNNNFLAQIGHRGILTILPVEGEFHQYGKNEIGEVYDWGFTSQRWGYGDAVQEPIAKVEEVVAKKGFSFGKKQIVTETVGKVVTTDPVTAKSTVKDAATEGTAPRTSVPEVKASDKKQPEAVRPPGWCHSNDDVKNFYRMVFGSVPQNWKKKLPVIPMEGVVVPQKLEDVRHFAAEKAKANIVAANVIAPAATATAAPAPATPAAAPKSGGEIAEARKEESPIIGPKDMEKVLDFVAKHLDGEAASMMKPSEIQALEKKLGKFSESVGQTSEEMLNWPVTGVFALAKLDHRAIAQAFLEVRALWRDTLKVEDLVNTKSTTTVTKSGEGTVKTESISNEAAPAAKKGWWGSKKAA